jgi:ABC transport system ATP-binding/permease protein
VVPTCYGPAVVVLGAQELTRSFGLRTVLQGVSFAIEEGERVGLVGLNGAGKTTLGRIVAGADQPDSGRITLRRGATVGYLPQVPRLDPDLTAHAVVVGGMRAWTDATNRHAEISKTLESGEGQTDALLRDQAAAAAEIERLGGWDRAHEADAVLEHLGILRHDAKVGTLSGGEQRRVALARLLVSRPDLAVFDEPTNHLDIETIEWLERTLCSSFPGAALLVTHDRCLLDRVVGRTFEIDHGKLFAYEGGFEAYLEAKAERLELARRTEANRQNYLLRELEWLRRSPKARTGKQKARIARIDDVLGQQIETTHEKATLEATSTRSGRTILEAHGLTLRVQGRTLVEGFDLSMRKGDRVGIVGPNGVGKTTLIRALTGHLDPDGAIERDGEVRLGKNTRIAYLDQLRSGLAEQSTVYDAVADGRSHLEIGGRTLEVRAWLERFLFEGPTQRQRIDTLSGGERARVALAKLLAAPANLLVLDEPTNDLDVDTLGALESMLVEFEGTCLVVTHDRWFLDRVATAIVAFEGDGRAVRYEGDYETYRRLRAKVTPSPPPTRTTAATHPTPQRPARRGLTYAERLELERLETEVEEADALVDRLEAALADPESYGDDGTKARDLGAQLEEAKREAARLMDRWEALELAREQGDGKRTRS